MSGLTELVLLFEERARHARRVALADLVVAALNVVVGVWMLFAGDVVLGVAVLGVAGLWLGGVASQLCVAGLWRRLVAREFERCP